MRGTRGGFGRWERKPLDAVADFCLGKMLDQKKNKGDLLPYLANVNVRWGEFDLKDLREMRFEHHELDRFGLKYGDIVMCEGGEPGRCAIWKEQMPGMMFQKALHRIRPRECLNKEFLFYLFLHRGRTGHFAPLFTGATIKHLPREKLAKVEVAVPPIPVQERIASILSAYDDLIENNRRRIQLLEQAARLLYKEWFVHLRFPGHEHVAITNGVPEGWKLCGMMEHPHFDLISENIGAFDGVKRYYATADITGIDMTGDGIDYTFEEKPSRAQKAPEAGSVWFARMQETYKVLVFTETNRAMAENSILSSGFAGIRARRAEFLPWLYLLINNAHFHEEKDRYCTGATQRSLTNGGLKRIRVLAPPGPMVSAFADVAGPVIEQILIIQALNKQLARARDTLLPRLMSGKFKLEQ